MRHINLDALDPDQLVSIGRVAFYLGVGVGTVRAYEGLGLRAHSRTVTGHRRYRVGDVQAFRRGRASV